jgi:hypothetical protein
MSESACRLFALKELLYPEMPKELLSLINHYVKARAHRWRLPSTKISLYNPPVPETRQSKYCTDDGPSAWAIDCLLARDSYTQIAVRNADGKIRLLATVTIRQPVRGGAKGSSQPQPHVEMPPMRVVLTDANCEFPILGTDDYKLRSDLFADGQSVRLTFVVDEAGCITVSYENAEGDRREQTLLTCPGPLRPCLRLFRASANLVAI